MNDGSNQQRNMNNYGYYNPDTQDRGNPDVTGNSTIIGLNSGQPLGLDLNNFGNDYCDQTIHSISTSNDLPIIAEVK